MPAMICRLVRRNRRIARILHRDFRHHVVVMRLFQRLRFLAGRRFKRCPLNLDLQVAIRIHGDLCQDRALASWVRSERRKRKSRSPRAAVQRHDQRPVAKLRYRPRRPGKERHIRLPNHLKHVDCRTRTCACPSESVRTTSPMKIERPIGEVEPPPDRPDRRPQRRQLLDSARDTSAYTAKDPAAAPAKNPR